MAAIDYSCSTAADCAVKNVGNCCGSYMACVNMGFVPDLAAVKDACQGMASICGWADISYCICQAGRCEGQQGLAPAAAAWPASNFAIWPAGRIAAVVIDGLLLLLLLGIVAVPRSRSAVCTMIASSHQHSLGHVLVGSIVFGAVGGVWWYLLPCIWWTCDGGPYDGHGIRIGFLSVSGPLLALCAFAYPMLLRRRRQLLARAPDKRSDSVGEVEPVNAS